MLNIKKAIVIILTAAFICFMYIESPYREIKSLKEAKASTVIKKGITDYIYLKGSVVELDRRELFPKCLSKVIDIHTKQGSKVQKGDILMTLKTENYEAAESVFYSELKNGVFSSGRTNVLSEQKSHFPERMPENIEYYIASPIDGIVMDIYSSEGDAVSGIFPCIAVSDMESLGVKADISENNIGEISDNMDCKIKVSAFSDKQYKGHISSVQPYASKSLPFEKEKKVKTAIFVYIENPDENIRPGYSADLKIITDYHSDKMILPYEYIGQDDHGEYVMQITKDFILKKQKVKTGTELSDGVEIVSGLKEGDYVAENPGSYKNGEKVKIK